MPTPPEEKERKMYYRECVAVFVVELLALFSEDDEILDAWLWLPTKQDKEKVRSELGQFGKAMSKIEDECRLKRQNL